LAPVIRAIFLVLISTMVSLLVIEIEPAI
jgi:hypothetical protein